VSPGSNSSPEGRIWRSCHTGPEDSPTGLIGDLLSFSTSADTVEVFSCVSAPHPSLETTVARDHVETTWF
jgi:hypothetical protein